MYIFMKQKLYIRTYIVISLDIYIHPKLYMIIASGRPTYFKVDAVDVDALRSVANTHPVRPRCVHLLQARLGLLAYVHKMLLQTRSGGMHGDI